VYAAPRGCPVHRYYADEIDVRDRHSLLQLAEVHGCDGADGMKKLNDLSASAIEESATNLFAFSPKKSYVEENWIKEDPEFWKP